MSGKLNLNANFWTESKVRLAQQKLLLKTDHMFTLFLLSSARKIVDVTAIFTNGPRAQYLRPNPSRIQRTRPIIAMLFTNKVKEKK